MWEEWEAQTLNKLEGYRQKNDKEKTGDRGNISLLIMTQSTGATVRVAQRGVIDAALHFFV